MNFYIRFRYHFLMPFSSLLGAFGYHFGAKNLSKIDQKIIKKPIQKPLPKPGLTLEREARLIGGTTLR